MIWNNDGDTCQFLPIKRVIWKNDGDTCQFLPIKRVLWKNDGDTSLSPLCPNRIKIIEFWLLIVTVWFSFFVTFQYYLITSGGPQHCGVSKRKIHKNKNKLAKIKKISSESYYCNSYYGKTDLITEIICNIA